ncbi:MAG: Gfo/Idh/MocA family oxidoreductase [Actinobacteria bacterium]|nr:Gfo/Idh/MocA family oxidoreductase [Actinomycetota bacterium]
MIIVDRLLEARAGEGRPVRVGMVGAGFMGQGIANQIARSTPGMELVAIANRHPDRAREAYAYAGVDDVDTATSPADLDRSVAAGRVAVTDDPTVLTRAGSVEVIVEVTGAVDHAARVILDAIGHGTHVVSMNAEVDGTVGPLLQLEAEAAGVVYTSSGGDQPGVQGDLVRFVRGIGCRPLVVGNIKGLQDEYRTPTTQQGFAEQWGQNVNMVTSFADGTKISFEQATVANAFGLTVPKRGMNGFDWDGHVDDATALYDLDELETLGGVVDYLVKAKPGPGVFCFATHDDPKQQHYLNLYKLGEGPLYAFYRPYHLCHFEVPETIARAVLLGDATLRPDGAPTVEVITLAKTDLPAGTVLDRLGGYHTYGQAERADTTADGRLLPIGVAEGCRLVRDVARDAVLTYDDVEVPPGRLVDELRARQAERLPPAPRDATP